MPLMFNSGIRTSSEGSDMDTILPYIDQYLYYDRFNTEEPFIKNVYTEYDKDIVVCTFEDEEVIVDERRKMLPKPAIKTEPGMLHLIEFSPMLKKYMSTFRMIWLRTVKISKFMPMNMRPYHTKALTILTLTIE